METKNTLTPQTSEQESDTRAAIDAGIAIASLRDTSEGATIAILPRGCTATILDQTQLDKSLAHPKRVTGAFSFGDVESFNRYVNKFKDEDTAVFATVTDTSGTFRAVLNFHSDGNPSWNDHTAHHELKPTLEWQFWNANNRKRMSQVEFATFLEENAAMFTQPSGADLLELITNLEGHSNASINSGVKLKSGAIKLEFNEEVELKGSVSSSSGSLEIPGLLTAGIAPFQGAPAYAIKARLRYRIESRKLVFWYEAVDQHLVVRAVIKGILDKITEATGIAPYIV